jgi:hypothetical protein
MVAQPCVGSIWLVCGHMPDARPYNYCDRLEVLEITIVSIGFDEVWRRPLIHIPQRRPSERRRASTAEGWLSKLLSVKKTADPGIRGFRAVGPPSVLPEILEPIGRHVGISNRVHDIFVAHVVLESSGVVPVVGKLVAGGVAKHVRVDRKWELGGFSGSGDRLQKSRSRGRTTALGNENVSRFHILST